MSQTPPASYGNDPKAAAKAAKAYAKASRKWYQKKRYWAIAVIVIIIAIAASSAGGKSGSGGGGGANTNSTSEQSVTAGSAFQQGTFKFNAGWKIVDDGIGDWTVKNLSATNTSSDSKTLYMDFNLYNGKTLVGSITCTTSNDVPGKTAVAGGAINCLPLSNKSAYTRVTVRNSF